MIGAVLVASIGAGSFLYTYSWISAHAWKHCTYRGSSVTVCTVDWSTLQHMTHR